MSEDAFFMDGKFHHFKAIGDAIDKLNIIAYDYEVVVFPGSGLGTGLAKMGDKAPLLMKYMNNRLCKEFGICYK